MNCYKHFLSMKPLEIDTRPPAKQGDLINPRNNYTLNRAEVELYNHYTHDFNRIRNCRAAQEQILTNRFIFFTTRQA